MAGKIKIAFPGGNTSKGFYSFFDNMIPKDNNRIFCIKGGPGVGKSSMMKKIANELVNIGYDVELFQCSSDPRSLDGVVIPKLKVVLVDGTAPHIVDPKYPGGVDEVVNLGDHWNLRYLEQNKDNIVNCTNAVGRCFERTYRYLGAAAPIYRDIEAMYMSSIDFAKINELTSQLVALILEGVEANGTIGEVRHLFGSGYTPLGNVECTDTILQYTEKIYYLNGEIGTGKTTLLTKLYTKAIELGLNVEAYHTPLIPEKLETLIIKELDIAITTSEIYKENNIGIIDLNEYLDADKVEANREKLEYSYEVLNNLIDYALVNLKEAKALHDQLETYYVPAMNFDEIENLKDELIDRILKYEV